MQLSRLGAVVPASLAEIAASREHFDAHHYLRLPRFIDDDLLGWARQRLQREEFHRRTHQGIGVELCLPAGPLSATLELMANDEELFEVLRRMTGCGRIGCFDGRVYRMVPGSGHYDSWHSDAIASRLVAMSVNLSEEPYEGGNLQIRDARGREMVSEVADVGFGEAVIFRISPHLRHRVTATEGSLPRTAYAGWFQAQPEYRRLLKARLASG